MDMDSGTVQPLTFDIYYYYDDSWVCGMPSVWIHSKKRCKETKTPRLALATDRKNTVKKNYSEWKILMLFIAHKAV